MKRMADRSEATGIPLKQLFELVLDEFITEMELKDKIPTVALLDNQLPRMLELLAPLDLGVTARVPRKTSTLGADDIAGVGQFFVAHRRRGAIPTGGE